MGSGGDRKGAGRKPNNKSGAGKITSVYIDYDNIEFYNQHAKQKKGSQMINDAIRLHKAKLEKK